MLAVPLIFCIFNFLSIFGEAAKLPEYIPRCSVKDPNFFDCYTNAVETSLGRIKNGIPSIKMIAIDPMSVPEIKVKQGSGPIAITLTLRNVKIHGLGDMKFVKAWTGIREGNASMSGESTLENMQIIADYKMSGRILIFPISGEGRSNITLKNVYLKNWMDNEIITRDGKDYIRNIRFKHTMEPKEINMDFENLFGGNAELSRQMNMILNANAKDLFQDFQPTIGGVLGQVFSEIANQLFLKVPYKSIFLP